MSSQLLVSKIYALLTYFLALALISQTERILLCLHSHNTGPGNKAMALRHEDEVVWGCPEKIFKWWSNLVLCVQLCLYECNEI